MALVAVLSKHPLTIERLDGSWMNSVISAESAQCTRQGTMKTTIPCPELPWGSK